MSSETNQNDESRRPTLSQSVKSGMVLLALLAVSLVPSIVMAQNRPKRRVIRIEETRVEGRIQKPQAFYILQRSNLNFRDLQMKKSFVPKILNSVHEPVLR